jgi:hypothetical protein
MAKDQLKNANNYLHGVKNRALEKKAKESTRWLNKHVSAQKKSHGKLWKLIREAPEISESEEPNNGR